MFPHVKIDYEHKDLIFEALYAVANVVSGQLTHQAEGGEGDGEAGAR